MREKLKAFWEKTKDFCSRHKKPLLIGLLVLILLFLFLKKKSADGNQLVDNYYVGNSGVGSGSTGYYDNTANAQFSELVNYMNEMYLAQNENLNSALGAMADQQAQYQYAQSESYADLLKALTENKTEVIEKMVSDKPDQTASNVSQKSSSGAYTSTAGDSGQSTAYDNASTQLRSWAADRGYVVGYDQATGNVVLNGLQFNESAFTKVDGYNYLTNAQISQLDEALSKTSRPSSSYSDGQEVSIRGYLESRGHVVGWQETSQGRFITVDGKKYNADQAGIVFKNNSTYSTVQNIRNIFGI